MKHVIHLLAGIAVVSAAAGCGSTDFGGGAGKRAATDRTGSTSGNTPGQNTPGGKPVEGDETMTPPPGATPEQNAIGKCLKAWGQNPFGQAAFQDFRTISASVNVLGSGYVVDDTEVTQAPRLIVVKAAVSVLGESNYALMNPNGWYCIMVDVSVMSKIHVDLSCQAKLADNKVSVNVGSTGTAPAAVGVAVMSDVTVNRTPAKGGKGGC